jgi:hypothetical protein
MIAIPVIESGATLCTMRSRQKFQILNKECSSLHEEGNNVGVAY